MTKDEMVGWHHQLNGHEFVQAPRVSDGQRSLALCIPQGLKESDTTEQVNRNCVCVCVCVYWREREIVQNIILTLTTIYHLTRTSYLKYLFVRAHSKSSSSPIILVSVITDLYSHPVLDGSPY